MCQQAQGYGVRFEPKMVGVRYKNPCWSATEQQQQSSTSLFKLQVQSTFREHEDTRLVIVFPFAVFPIFLVVRCRSTLVFGRN